jgi:hypothetical protein
MDDEMVEILVELSENNLFFHDEFKQVTSPFWDLCLFREDGSLLLGTVSHEYDADFYLTEEEMERCRTYCKGSGVVWLDKGKLGKNESLFAKLAAMDYTE